MGESKKCLDFLEYSDERLQSCLREFVKSNNIEAIRLVVQKGISVNVGDSSGVTPLHVASMSNITLQCLKELLKSESVNINTETCYGDTPLIYSCQTSSDKVLKILIEHGADVNLSNFKKLTPMHIACWNGCWEAVKLLIKAGANVNAKDIRDMTPLHIAISIGSIEMCQYLLEHGADANIPNEVGLLPLHIAVSKRNCEVYDLIRRNTTCDTLLKYCTFPGPSGNKMVNRSVLCLALGSRNKALIERILKSGLPNEVLNCPMVVKQPFLLNDYLNEKGELESFDERLVLFTPLCFFLQLYCENYKAALDVLKMLIDNKICVTSSFTSSDSVYVAGCIEIMLHTWYQQVDRFKIITMLLQNGIDADEESKGMPTKLLKLCLMRNVDKSIFMLLLKASNVVEPDEILRWIVDNRNREFVHCRGVQELVYMLLVLSPYFTMPASIYNYFVSLSSFEKSVSQKIKHLCEHPVRPLASYCRAIIRRQLHYETRNNHREFKEKLNSLAVPKTVISYLQFGEVKFTIDESTEIVSCQLICDL